MCYLAFKSLLIFTDELDNVSQKPLAKSLLDPINNSKYITLQSLCLNIVFIISFLLI